MVFWFSKILILSSFLMSAVALGLCPKGGYKRKQVAQTKIYEKYPFKAGEMAVYKINWSGLHAGTANMQVRAPELLEGYYHQSFSVVAQTGDWFKSVYEAIYSSESLSRSEDFAAIRFYLTEFKNAPMAKVYRQEKELSYDHEKDCKTEEFIETLGEKSVRKTHALEPGAVDALSAFYKLRTLDYKAKKSVKFMTYSSGKNWWLEAKPLGEEEVVLKLEGKNKTSKYVATKIQLQTYFGQQLQQQGNVCVWIARSSSRPLLKVSGQVKLGRVEMLLTDFQPGSGSL